MRFFEPNRFCIIRNKFHISIITFEKVFVILFISISLWQLSGRGLGLTGGTLDKLESIRGFAVDLSSEQMNECLSRAGCFIASPTSDICPGDKATYSYRDVTATVDCINLIVGMKPKLNIFIHLALSTQQLKVYSLKLSCFIWQQTILSQDKFKIKFRTFELRLLTDCPEENSKLLH